MLSRSTVTAAEVSDARDGAGAAALEAAERARFAIAVALLAGVVRLPADPLPGRRYSALLSGSALNEGGPVDTDDAA